jgi:hypothetical protein
MKTKRLRVFILSIAAGGFVSGCVVQPNGRVAFQPFVVVAPQPMVVVAPPPVEVAPVMVPDSYAWDGYEYVGLVGDQYYYLGPGNAIPSGWIVSMDGNEAMPIGGHTPSAMTVTGRIAMAMSSQGATTGVDTMGRTDIESAQSPFGMFCGKDW